MDLCLSLAKLNVAVLHETIAFGLLETLELI